MSNLTKGLILLVVILGIGGGLVVWKNGVGGHSSGSFNTFTKEEIGILLADVAKVNPMALKRLSDDPELKKRQLDDLKQLLAFASEAQKEGITNEQPYRQELANIKHEVIAANYDREINKDKGPMPPFGFISEDQIKAFWGEGEQPQKGWFDSLKEKIGLGREDNELAFQRFLDTKLQILKESNPQMKDREISDDERTQAKEFFAKVQIYADEYNEKASSGELSKEFQNKVELQVKLQQAQFLARITAEKLTEKNKVTDEAVAKYIAENPEFDVSAKKAKANEILQRAKAGEDFAKLANEFTEDPGNKTGEGEGNGGLYKDVTKGRMVAPFEVAALGLEPGQIAPDVVETDFGFHIIKLERKGEGKDASGNPTETYDVRHILISTQYKDPENPLGRDVPLKTFVRQKLEQENEKKMLEELVARNHVEVPDDFDVPEVSDEQIQDLMQKQQLGNPQGGSEEGDLEEPPPPPAPKKSAEKK